MAERKQPRRKLTIRELVRQALIFAIQERQAYLDAIKGCGWEDTEKETKMLIAQMQAYSKKRFGS